MSLRSVRHSAWPSGLYNDQFLSLAVFSIYLSIYLASRQPVSQSVSQQMSRVSRWLVVRLSQSVSQSVRRRAASRLLDVLLDFVVRMTSSTSQQAARHEIHRIFVKANDSRAGWRAVRLDVVAGLALAICGSSVLIGAPDRTRSSTSTNDSVTIDRQTEKKVTHVDTEIDRRAAREPDYRGLCTLRHRRQMSNSFC